MSSLALVIDICISANLTIQPKNSKNFISNYSNFQQYVAITPVLLFQSFHDPQLKNPGSSLESTKTVVMKPNHNCIFLNCITVVLLQPLQWCCVDCVIHRERDVRKEQKYMYVARTSNNGVISSDDLHCCLLPQCEALRICRLGFLITRKSCCDQDVKVVPGLAFTQRTCDRCGSL